MPIRITAISINMMGGKSGNIKRLTNKRVIMLRMTSIKNIRNIQDKFTLNALILN